MTLNKNIREKLTKKLLLMKSPPAARRRQLPTWATSQIWGGEGGSVCGGWASKPKAKRATH